MGCRYKRKHMMPEKPFYSSTTVIILLPLLVFFVNVSLVYFVGMKTIQENSIDNIVHGVGGASVIISSAGILWHLVLRKIIVLEDTQVFRFVVFGCLCFVLISWEFLEYVIFHPHKFLTYADTISDMVCGLIGGILAMPILRRPVY